MIASLLLTLFLHAGLAMPGWSIGGAATVGGWWLPILAEVLPDPKSYEVMGWLIGGLMAVIIGIGGVFAAIIGGLTLIEKIRGTSKVMATTTASDSGPGRVEFDLHIDHLGDGMKKLQEGQDIILGKLEKWSGEQYRARGRMHRDINTLKNAMHFWAGKLAGQGDEDAKRLTSILDTSTAEDESE